MNYRYHLLKYSGPASRLTCPNCGKPHSLVPYVDDCDQIVGEEYGRCNHESSCGYCKYPPSEPDWRESWSEYQRRCKTTDRKHVSHSLTKVEFPEDVCTIPKDIVLRTVKYNPLSDFLRFLCDILDVETIMRLVNEYALGVTEERDVIFYQFDQFGRCRTGKVMKYGRDGHRIKDSAKPGAITWVHSLLMKLGVLPKDWKLTQCLFGEHLLKRYPDKPVCLVESEKSALIGSAFVPEYVWVATGGKSHIGGNLDVLIGRQVIAFPDADAHEEWKAKLAGRYDLDIQVSDIMVEYGTEEELRSGADIADVLVRWIHKHGNEVEQKPPPDIQFTDNPAMQTIAGLISEENLKEVEELIQDLDLEIVSVTKLTK